MSAMASPHQSNPPAQESLLTLPIGLGISAALAAIAVAGVALGAAAEAAGSTTSLRAHTVYTGCTLSQSAPGGVLMQCAGPTPTDIALTGSPATSVMSEPDAVHSVPVEESTSPGDAGYNDSYGGQTVFRIGVPYITEAG